MNQSQALLVIDVQLGVVDWEDPACRGSEVLSRIGELINRARASGVAVIFIQHDGDDGDELAVGSPGRAIHPAVTPMEGELIIRKRACDSFHETSLQRELVEMGIGHLIVVGCRTQYCVDTTCRRATSLGYDVTLVGDAHTTMSETLTAEQIIAHHNATLDYFGNDHHTVRVKAAADVVL